MEEIFIAIMERIAEKMPELSYIDEDYGQLDRKASHSSPYDWPLTATMTPTTPPEPITR